jgi:hypothetical protein
VAIFENRSLPRITASDHSHPHGLQIGRLLTAHRKIGRLRNVLILLDTPPHPGEGLSDLTEEDLGLQTGRVR